MTDYGTTDDSRLDYSAAESPHSAPDGAPDGAPAYGARLRVWAGEELAAVIEQSGTAGRSPRDLLLDALRAGPDGDRLVLPAEHLARARWQREHRSRPWSEVPPGRRAELLAAAATDLVAARGRDRRHDWHPHVELVSVVDPDDGPQNVRVFLDGVEVTSTSVTEVRLDPGRGYSTQDWAQLGRDLTTRELSPRAREVALLEHAAWVDGPHTTQGDPR